MHAFLKFLAPMNTSYRHINDYASDELPTVPPKQVFSRSTFLIQE